MKPDGSEQEQLTNNGQGGPRDAHPRFTPDGKTILFLHAANPTWDLPPRHVYVLDLATKRTVPVLTKRDIYTRPSLQPDS
jgi:Tol biopolymer transport system component